MANHASGGADCGSSPAGPAVSAGASSAQQPSGVAAVAAGTPGAAGSADSAGATTAAVPEEQRGLTARPACTAADAAGAAVPAEAQQPSTVTALAAREAAIAAGAAVPAEAQQPPGIATIAAPEAAVTAGAAQQSAVAAVATGEPTVVAARTTGGCRIGTVADQRAPEQSLDRRVDRVQQILLNVGRLSPHIRTRPSVRSRNEPVVKRRYLCADGLILDAVGAKERCDARRYLVRASS